MKYTNYIALTLFCGIPLVGMDVKLDSESEAKKQKSTSQESEDLRKDNWKKFAYFCFSRNHGGYCSEHMGEGHTELDLACTQKSIEKVEELLDKGASLKANALGYSPLHYAAMSDKEEFVKLLIKKGAEVDADVHALVDGAGAHRAPGDPGLVAAAGVVPGIADRVAGLGGTDDDLRVLGVGLEDFVPPVAEAVGERQPVVVVLGVHGDGGAQLLHIVQT